MSSNVATKRTTSQTVTEIPWRWERVVGAGLVASIAMGMLAMIISSLVGGSFWAPMIYIAAAVMPGLQTVGPHPGFALMPVMLGLLGHMMNSVVLGLIFSAVALRYVRGRWALVGAGVVWGLVVFLAMELVVLPAVDPIMLRMKPPAFLLVHLMWGAVLGFLNTDVWLG